MNAAVLKRRSRGGRRNPTAAGPTVRAFRIGGRSRVTQAGDLVVCRLDLEVRVVLDVQAVTGTLDTWLQRLGLGSPTHGLGGEYRLWFLRSVTELQPPLREGLEGAAEPTETEISLRRGCQRS